MILICTTLLSDQPPHRVNSHVVLSGIVIVVVVCIVVLGDGVFDGAVLVGVGLRYPGFIVLWSCRSRRSSSCLLVVTVVESSIAEGNRVIAVASDEEGIGGRAVARTHRLG